MKKIDTKNLAYLVLGYMAGGATLWALIQLGFLAVAPLFGWCGR